MCDFDQWANNNFGMNCKKLILLICLGYLCSSLRVHNYFGEGEHKFGETDGCSQEKSASQLKNRDIIFTSIYSIEAKRFYEVLNVDRQKTYSRVRLSQLGSSPDRLQTSRLFQNDKKFLLANPSTIEVPLESFDGQNWVVSWKDETSGQTKTLQIDREDIFMKLMTMKIDDMGNQYNQDNSQKKEIVLVFAEACGARDLIDVKQV